MNDYTENDYQRVVAAGTETSLLPGTTIEVVSRFSLSEFPQHVLFDFDGTLSLIREGWPDVMIPMMVEVLEETETDEPCEKLHDLVHEFVMTLNGKQTIYQMIRLAEEVAERGGRPQDPSVYKQMYHDRLMLRIQSRRDDLSNGRVPREEMLVPCSIELLEALVQRGVHLYLASGTDENYVQEECRLLGIDGYFGEHIYGAIDDFRSFSKARVIERIMKENNVDGSRLLGFGDGYIEIQNIKTVGGVAVGVASNEKERNGKVDPWKRDRLIGVGADLVVPDFRDYQQIISYFWSQ